jgi:hypothetical protein
MLLNYNQYQYHCLIDNILITAQDELKEYLKIKTQQDMAPLEWFEKQYGQELPHRDILKLWWTVPSIRAGKYTEWAPLMPKLSEAAFNLPGIVNFSLNCISPGGQIPVHSDYTYDMREDLSKIKKAYVILVAVDIPSDSLDKCGFELGGNKIYLKTGDIIAFNGNIPHGSWNYTSQWRYTINMDIEESYWNV